MTTSAEKLAQLEAVIRDMESVVVGFSGGVDSTLLLKVALDVLGGESVIAVTAHSATLETGELEAARALTRRMGIEHIVIDAGELSNEQFASNPPERCYVCKKLRFLQIEDIRRERGVAFVIDGTNAEDADDWRPGIQAAEELGVRSPLKEADLTKAAIRQLSRELHLPTSDKPSAPCLASRVPYGERITEAKLKQIAAAEQALREFGFSQVRVRHHGDTARIEVPRAELEHAAANAEAIAASITALGFHFVSLDLAGFTSGSLNKPIGKA